MNNHKMPDSHYPSDIPETANIAITNNATTVMMEEMKRECKEKAAQMKQLTAMLLSAATNTTLLPATTPPVADDIFYNPNATCRVCHPTQKMCRCQASSKENQSIPPPPAPTIG